MEFFDRDKQDAHDPLNNESIIDFMNQNAEVKEDLDIEDPLNKELQKKFKLKSTWRPNPPNRALDIFQRSVKQEILKVNLNT